MPRKEQPKFTKNCTATRRCPVVYKGKPLMPMRWSRVKQYQKEKKGVLVQDRLGNWYFKLKVEPTDFKTQEISLGIDPGTKFTSVSVVTSKVHNANVQRIHPKTKSIQENAKARSDERRQRRSRLRHREARFLLRNRNTTTKTCHYLIQVRCQIVKDMMKLYPITHIIHEEVVFNHYKSNNGSTFSNVEIGKTKWNTFLNRLNVIVSAERGFTTMKLRKLFFNHDLKCRKNKGCKSFYAHGIDSFVLANQIFYEYHIKEKKKQINTIILWNEELLSSSRVSRRTLREFTGKAKKCDISYFRKLTNSKIKLIKRYHKAKKVRVKIDNSKSNHGPWQYTYSFEPNSCEIVKRKYKKLYGSFKQNRKNRKLLVHKTFNQLSKYYNKQLISNVVK